MNYNPTTKKCQVILERFHYRKRLYQTRKCQSGLIQPFSIENEFKLYTSTMCALLIGVDNQHRAAVLPPEKDS